jgi:integrase
VGPVSANRAAEALRALYKHAAKLNRALPPVIPTSGVTFNVERPKQVGLAFNQFKAWAKAWDTIKSPKRRAFHLFSLLSGCRPNEAAMLKWQDVDCRRRVIVFGNTKAGADVTIPMTREIAAALRIVPKPRGGDDLVFPCCRKSSRKDRLVKGHALRHTYRTVAADLGVDEVVVRLLMGHSLQGVSQAYIAKAALTGGISMREAQRKISKRIVGLLGIVL